MQRRYSLAHLILASVVVLGLTPLMVCVDAQARIAFSSEKDGNREIYVMGNDGGNPRRLTNNNRQDNGGPAWFGPAFAVAPAGKIFRTWGWLKQVDR